MFDWSNWLPNIVCTVGGLIAGWLLGRRQSKVADKHTVMLETLLVGAEKQGAIELARDKDGRITGGRNITIKAEGLRISTTLGQVGMRKDPP